MLLALATLGVSYYYLHQMPYNYWMFLPANIFATGSLIFWVRAPARKRARARAAFASLLVVPAMFATAAIGFLRSPIEMWEVFLALTALSAMIAGWALIRVRRKASHPWADYYRQVT